jgi:5-formyltetrahydrofolate cyclo-ligase
MEGSLIKARLRKDMRSKRQSLSNDTRRSFDHAINQNLLNLVTHAGITSLSAFWPFDGEPDLRPALLSLHEMNVKVTLPVIDDDPAAVRLLFRQWNPSDRMINNHYGIEQPREGESVRLEDLDLVLLPLVAWNEKGHRLGMGAGYYDRTFSKLAHKEQPLRVGIAYELQKNPSIPTDPWDIGLHQVITENGRFTCSP